MILKEEIIRVLSKFVGKTVTSETIEQMVSDIKEIEEKYLYKEEDK